MRHETVFRPRVTEINFAGHVSNTVLPVWYEEALHDFFRQKIKMGAFPYLLVRMDQQFKREIFHGTDVLVSTAVEKIGNTSVTFFQEVWQNDALAAEATTVLVSVSESTNLPVPLTDELRRCLSEYFKEIAYEDS
jgi:acyl-CoA thioester hydrolase